jgi:hypothetical protein
MREQDLSDRLGELLKNIYVPDTVAQAIVDSLQADLQRVGGAAEGASRCASATTGDDRHTHGSALRLEQFNAVQQVAEYEKNEQHPLQYPLQ